MSDDKPAQPKRIGPSKEAIERQKLPVAEPTLSGWRHDGRSLIITLRNSDGCILTEKILCSEAEVVQHVDAIQRRTSRKNPPKGDE